MTDIIVISRMANGRGFSLYKPLSGILSSWTATGFRIEKLSVGR
jgi:hypothetical protein